MVDSSNWADLLLKQPAKALMDACAHEISKLELELQQAKGRVLQRVAECLLPESWLGPFPRTMVVQVPRKLTVDDGSDLEFVYADGTSFLPSWKDVPIFDAEIIQQEVLSKDCALSLKVQVQELQELFGKRIYFEFDEDTDGSLELYRLLPFTRLSIQGRKLQTMVRSNGDLTQNAVVRRKEGIHTVYDTRFVEIVGFDESDVPKEMELRTQNLATIEDASLWVKIQFPLTTSPDLLSHVRCHLNCVPVVNVVRHILIRKLERGYQAFELNAREGFFAGIESVVFDPDRIREAVPFDCYSIRRSGITQFSDLDGKAKILDALHTLNDEYQAYRGVREEYEKDLNHLYERISDLESRITSRATSRDEPPVFLQFHDIPKAGEIEITYLVTNGDRGGKPGKGDSLKCKGGTARVMTESRSLSQHVRQDHIEQLKHTIVSRGRIVTKADIASACRAFLGSSIGIEEKHIKRGAMLSPNQNEGLVECILVTINPKAQARMTREEWGTAARNLELYLEENSLVALSFRVSVDFTRVN